MTGVRLEIGSQATPFEHRPYAEELASCQRYYWKISDNTYRRCVAGYKRHDSYTYFEIVSPVPMRAAPSPTLTDSGTFTNFQNNFNTTQSSPSISEWDVNAGRGLLAISSNYSSTHLFIPSWEGYAMEFSAEI